jgi:hypothetical protein
MAENRAWAVVAASQHGVVARRQLGECGLTSKSVQHAVASGRLAWLTPRVPAVVGSADTPTGSKLEWRFEEILERAGEARFERHVARSRPLEGLEVGHGGGRGPMRGRVGPASEGGPDRDCWRREWDSNPR